eukprot:m51a1_g10764 hypothetical protein (705) ;mRNA; f:17702-19993
MSAPLETFSFGVSPPLPLQLPLGAGAGAGAVGPLSPLSPSSSRPSSPLGGPASAFRPSSPGSSPGAAPLLLGTSPSAGSGAVPPFSALLQAAASSRPSPPSPGLCPSLDALAPRASAAASADDMAVDETPAWPRQPPAPAPHRRAVSSSAVALHVHPYAPPSPTAAPAAAAQFPAPLSPLSPLGSAASSLSSSTSSLLGLNTTLHRHRHSIHEEMFSEHERLRMIMGLPDSATLHRSPPPLAPFSLGGGRQSPPILQSPPSRHMSIPDADMAGPTLGLMASAASAAATAGFGTPQGQQQQQQRHRRGVSFMGQPTVSLSLASPRTPFMAAPPPLVRQVSVAQQAPDCASLVFAPVPLGAPLAMAQQQQQQGQGQQGQGQGQQPQQSPPHTPPYGPMGGLSLGGPQSPPHTPPSPSALASALGAGLSLGLPQSSPPQSPLAGAGGVGISGGALSASPVQRFKLVHEPHETQRKSYRNERRYILPNPLVITWVGPPSADVVGTTEVCLVSEAGEDLPPDLQDALDGSRRKQLDEERRASFALMMRATSGDARFRLRVRVQYRVDGSPEEFVETILSQPFRVESNRKKNTTVEKPKVLSLKPTEGSMVGGEEVWIWATKIYERSSVRVRFGDVMAPVVRAEGNVIEVRAPPRPDLGSDTDVPVLVGCTHPQHGVVWSSEIIIYSYRRALPGPRSLAIPGVAQPALMM